MHLFVHSARDQAMRSVERVVDQCGCQVRDADRIDNLLRTQDTPTAVVSRWIAAAGDPDYRDAFLTILKGPMARTRPVPYLFLVVRIPFVRLQEGPILTMQWIYARFTKLS